MRDIAGEFSVKWDSKAFQQKISNPPAPPSVSSALFHNYVPYVYVETLKINIPIPLCYRTYLREAVTTMSKALMLR